jgi:phosphatidylglycerophosphatase A
MKITDTSPPPSPSVGRRRLSPVVWLATAAGVGFLPKSPGTWGSIVGIPLAIAVQQIPGVGWQAGVLALIALVGVPVCAIAAQHLGGAKDPGCIVLDEVVGMAVTLFLFDSLQPVTVIVAFALFRLFDISKPSPVREIEHLPHGWGIMADDLAAAVYAQLALRLIAWVAGSAVPGLLPLV